MPYIKKEDRDRIIEWEYDNMSKHAMIDVEEIGTAGEMQYAMAFMFKSYMKRKGLNYQNCNDVMGALAGAQMEFYRRCVQPYEDEKIKSNGDV